MSLDTYFSPSKFVRRKWSPTMTTQDNIQAALREALPGLLARETTIFRWLRVESLDAIARELAERVAALREIVRLREALQKIKSGKGWEAYSIACEALEEKR